MNDLGHGVVGTREQSFVRLLPQRPGTFDEKAIYEISGKQNRPDDPKDGRDPEENILVPAGYTYLGQFVDHDLTFDSTSTLNPDDANEPTNMRTPSFDLDCVYGDGPAGHPYLYKKEPDSADLAQLRVGVTAGNQPDLMRDRTNDGKIDPDGRAIIGDKRNDENSIVSQIQLAFINFHNKIVEDLRKTPDIKGGERFGKARDEVRWTYQKMLVEDYLRRIVEKQVYDEFIEDWNESGDAAFKLFHPRLRTNIPLEFAGAAYRFGHSMVRVGYRLNPKLALPVFAFDGDASDSLTGFQPLPDNHVIDDWGRFFPDPDLAELWPGHEPAVNEGIKIYPVKDGGRPDVRLQFAYKIDPSMTGPLGDLPPVIAGLADGNLRPLPKNSDGSVNTGPALGVLNLMRGNKFHLPSGQTVAAALNLDGTVVSSDLMVRVPVKDAKGKDREGIWTFEPFPAALVKQTPLWLYILAEAQRHIVRTWADPHDNNKKEIDEKKGFFFTGVGAKTQLGPIGGRIVLETFCGLLSADKRSYLNAAPAGWTPMIMAGEKGPLTFSRVLKWLADGKKFTNGFGAF